MVMSESIDVWILDSSEFELADLEANTISLLSAPEKARYARYDLARSKRQLLLARAMLRTVLARYVEDEVLQISLGAHGRPQLVGESDLSFNLSHSRDRVVVAVTRLGVVGVDVEYAARQRRVEKLIARYFSQREQSALLALPESSRLPRFYALWALKEAYIKARGLGLAIPLADFSFSFAEDAGASEAYVKPQGSVSISFEGSLAAQSPTPWRFWRGALAGEEYAFGLALHSSGEPHLGRDLSSDATAGHKQRIELTVRYCDAALGLEHWRDA
tara:strand:+ start:3509 stop:4330 length:822 start_codon:yes stop_codon:yes gene_type:complete